MRKNRGNDAKTVGLLALLCALVAPAAFAELADRDKPLNLEADSVTVDDAKKISVYQGNVTLNQGTLLIRAGKLVVTEDKDGYQHSTAHGNPANFRQKREGLDEYIEAMAARIEYDSRREQIELHGQARLKRNQDEVRGDFISYDSKTELFKVIGGKQTVTPNNPRGRVRAVIQPKRRGTAADAPSSGGSALKPAEGIAHPRED